MNIHVWQGETISILPFRYKQRANEAFIDKNRIPDDDWRRMKLSVLQHLKQGTAFDLYIDALGGHHYLPIVLPSDDANELLDDDLMRSFEQGVQNTRELTKSKWERLVKIGIVFLCVLFGIGAFLLFMVLLNKGQTDFASSFTGIVNQGGFNITKVFGA